VNSDNNGSIGPLKIVFLREYLVEPKIIPGSWRNLQRGAL
jgi:hypothetical protein